MEGNTILVYSSLNPVQPKEIGFINTPGWALDVTANDTVAYVANATYGLRVFDTSDKTKPTECKSSAKMAQNES